MLYQKRSYLLSAERLGLPADDFLLEVRDVIADFSSHVLMQRCHLCLRSGEQGLRYNILQ